MNVEHVPTTGRGRGFVRLAATNEVVELEYGVHDGDAIFEGDIVLGRAEELAASTPDAPHEYTILARHEDGRVEASMIVGAGYRWTDNVIPYEIASDLPGQDRVHDALGVWESLTPLRFPRRTTEPNFVVFARIPEGCKSKIGKQGGKQTISLADNCTEGNVIHEIGHTVGLVHEHSRWDRDTYVDVDLANLAPEHKDKEPDFARYGQMVATMAGPYDYGSVMHYPRDAFAKPHTATIVPKDPSAVIGQRSHLSAGDVAAVSQLAWVGLRSYAASELALDLAGGSATPGTRILLFQHDEAKRNQKWQLVDNHAGSYAIHSNVPGACIASDGPGAAVVAQRYSATDPSQRWALVETRVGVFEIVHRPTGMLLTAEPTWSDSGPYLKTRDSSLGTKQWWWLAKVDQP